MLFGVRATRMTAAVSSILFTSEQNEEQASDKPRFLLFSDSVQDAAQRGAVTEVRNAQSVIQKALYQSIVEHAGGFVNVHSLVDELPRNLHNSLGPDEFSALFIPRDLTWKKSYQELVSVNKAVEDRALLRAIEERLSWSIFEHLTFKSHMLTSLEGHSIAIADVETIQLAETTSRFAKQLANASKEFSDINLNELTQFIFGVIQRLRRQGSVAHPYLVKAIENHDPWAN